MADVPSHLTLLNPEQYRAVVTSDGPLLILAGAGSGKTRVLTRRIAHVLHNGTEPERVFAVTFTNKAAAEMKERVVELVGSVGSKCWVSTFHSSCCRILRAEIEVLGWTRRFAIYDDDDQRRVVKGIIDDLGFDPTRIEPRAILSQIDHYKNQLRTPQQLVAEQRAHDREPFIQVWLKYEEAMIASDALDFNDLIGVTVRLFKEHPDVLAKWQERFQYIMVDEYQDTNRAQYLLLTALAAKHRNLAVVGDDDQSIYGFRGADISIIRGFQADYPEATIIRLEQNYRSSANILALSNHVIAVDEQRITKRLWTDAAAGPKVRLVATGSPKDEAIKVAGAILGLRRQGVRNDDIAIIYRTNATSRAFEMALRDRRIPHKIIGGKKFYARREVRDALSYLRLVVNLNDDAAFLRVVNVPPRGVGANTLAELRVEATARGTPLLRTARGHRPKNARAREGLAKFVGLIDDLSDAARNTSPAELTVRALVESGYLEMLEADVGADGKPTQDAVSRRANLDELARDAASFEMPSALTSLDVLTGWLDRIALTADSDEIPEDGEVTLMTVHNAKGLEYPVVFVVQMVEGQFPHARSEGTGIEEERRLAYVAFTRAKERLFITRSRTAARFDARDGEQVEPSRFLFGLPEEHCDGDLPDGEPAGAIAISEDEGQSKLRAFLERRAATPDTGEFTLVEIEDPSQVHEGVRVHHAKLGAGEVRRISAGSVYVRFGSRTVPVRGHELKLLQE